MSNRKQGNHNRTKLFMAGAGLITALAVLGAGSYAWLTLSTNPESGGIEFTVNSDQSILISTDGTHFSRSEEIELEDDLVPLVPVSTADGLNWFASNYSANGDVMQKAGSTSTQFTYMRFPEGGNVTEDTEENQASSQNNGTYGFYIHTEIYLKTDEESVDVYLSVPSSGTGYEGNDDDTEKDHYGTYVLAYGTEDNAEGSSGESAANAKTVTLLNQVAETSARVGFLILGSDTTGPEKDSVTTNGTAGEGDNQFFIYEPNADTRSAVAKEDTTTYKADKYIVGFTAKGFTENGKTYSETNGYYYQTYPIGINSAAKTTLKSLLDDENGLTITNDDETTTTYKGNDLILHRNNMQVKPVIDGEPVIFPASHLIVQTSSTWKDIPVAADPEETEGQDTPAVAAEGDGDGSTEPEDEAEDTGDATLTATQITKIENLDFDSTMLKTMGSFVNPSALYDDITLQKNADGEYTNTSYKIKDLSTITKNVRSDAMRPNTKLLTLTKAGGKQKIRIYFWIEGQDVDCWNDISNTSFLVNLEFVAD